MTHEHTPGTVAVVGSINVDEIVAVERHPLPGETLLATGASLAPGGKGANQAVAAARLGARVRLVGGVGDDDRAAVALQLLGEAGVDLSSVARMPAPTGIARITVDAAGENTIIVIPGANADVTPATIDAQREPIAGAAVVVLQGEIPADASARAAEIATGRVLLNLAPVIDVPTALLQAADPLVVNEHEARLLLAATTDAASAVVTDAGTGTAARTDTAPGTVARTDTDIAQQLFGRGIRSVVLTRGERGAICVDEAGITDIPSPRVAAVDTSGAGDAFVGALAARLAAGHDLRAAARYAARVGAFAVQATGTQPSYPWATDALPAVGIAPTNGSAGDDETCHMAAADTVTDAATSEAER